jgi:PAS domain S-box-containing protein
MAQEPWTEVGRKDGGPEGGLMPRSWIGSAWRSVGRLHRGIGWRLLVGVLLFSSAVTLVLALLQLYVEYRQEVGAINRRLSEIEGSYVQSLGEGLWNLDRRQIELQIEEILRLPAVRFVEVRETGDRADPMTVAAGRRQDRAAVSREYPVLHTYHGKEQQLGVISVQATLDEVYSTLLDRAVFILVSQGAKTFLVSFFILYIAGRLVTRHLTALAGFLGGYNLGQPSRPFRLQRREPKEKDELDQLVTAFEAMRRSLERAYHDLRRSEADYRGIYENALEGILRMSPDGRVVGANPAYARMLGFASPDEVVQTVTDFGRQFWRDPTEWTRLVATLLERGAIVGYEAKLRRKDRQPLWVSMSSRVVRDDVGAPLFFESIVSDVTLRKKMETALRESEQRFRDYAETASDWFWATGPAHEFTWLSEQVGAFGWDQGTVIGKRRWDVAADVASEPGKWREHMATLERREPFRDFVYEARRVDGAPSFLSVSGKPVFDTDGRFAGYRGVARDFTKRKRAEEALRRSEAYLAEAQRLSHTGSWAWNVAGRQITHCSQEIYRLYGLDPAGGMPSFKSLLERVHPDDRYRLGKSVDDAVDRKTDLEADFRIVLPDARTVFLHSVGHPVFNPSGDVVEFVGTSMDVTERERAQEERQASLWFFESMDRVNRAIQGTNDPERMMSDVLDTVLSIFGCDRAWLVYPCDPEAASWHAQMEHTRPDFPGAFALGVDLPMDAEVAGVFRIARAASGAVRFGPGSEHPVPAQLAEGFSIRSIIGMAVYPKVDKPYLFGLHQCSYPRVWTPPEERLFQEIGRRLGDALTSLLTVRDLRESEARLEEAQRIAHVGYWGRDLVTDRVTWSDETYRVFGLAPQERVLSSADFQKLLHPDDRAIVVGAVAEAAAGGARYDVEYRAIRPGGEVRTIHSQGDVTRDASGRPRRIFGTVQDITERKRAEERLRESERRYREVQMELAHVNRVTTMGQLTASIAHEVSQPITATVTNAGAALRWLRAQPPDLEEVRQALGRIIKDGNRAGHVIGRVRDLIKRVPPRVEHLDINETISEVLGLIRGELPRNGVLLRTDLTPGLPPVEGDRVQLQQVMLNLIVNAVEAMSGVCDGPRELRIGTENDGASVLVTVQDSGPGLSPDCSGRLFDAFYTTKPEGMGMGLSICRSIIEAHGGTIWPMANAPRGATFRFALPAQPASAP